MLCNNQSSVAGSRLKNDGHLVLHLVQIAQKLFIDSLLAKINFAYPKIWTIGGGESGINAA